MQLRTGASADPTAFAFAFALAFPQTVLLLKCQAGPGLALGGWPGAGVTSSSLVCHF